MHALSLWSELRVTCTQLWQATGFDQVYSVPSTEQATSQQKMAGREDCHANMRSGILRGILALTSEWMT